MKRREQNFLSKLLFAFFSVVIFSQSNKGLSISFPLLWIEGRFRMTRIICPRLSISTSDATITTIIIIKIIYGTITIS